MWNGRTKVETTWGVPREATFLLQETFAFLLLESGGKIKLENPFDVSTQWNGRIIPNP